MDEKAKRNARIGRIYYAALTDAAGYPNGMAYWGEMSAKDKYFYTVTGLQFISQLVEMGLASTPDEVGLKDRYGEGDCAALLAHFEATEADERMEFETRVRMASGVLRGPVQTKGDFEG